MRWGSTFAVCVLVACTSSKPGLPPLPLVIKARVGSTRFVTREHFIASGEMQISGEPLAESMGRDLGGYSRARLPPDLYFDPQAPSASPRVDVPGFATGVESYEYSKQPMNEVAFETGAGTSLVYGPILNTGQHGLGATARLAARLQQFAGGSGALGRFVSGTGPGNPLGWPGIWPTLHVFRSFDPTVDPSHDVTLFCSISSDDNPGTNGGLLSADYECDATSLHLRDRTAQIDPVVTPGADGFSAWKYGLWVLNYLQVMHDSTEAAVSAVAEEDLGQVGAPGNTVVGADDSGGATAAGTYLGSSNIEGFQAQLFLEEIDERAQDWLSNLTTTDGVGLSGFESLQDALSYGYDSPLRWFPGAIAVTESDDGSGFPRPSYSLASPDSTLLDLDGLVLGYSEFYAATDAGNADVGGAQPARALFDGDPFPADDGKADGEATLHDRSLAMLRVALIDLDRIHADPATDILVDDVSMAGGVVHRGATVSTTSVAYTVLALRTALQSLSSQLELYSNNAPDTAILQTPIDDVGGGEPSASRNLAARLEGLLRTQAALLLDHLTDPGGRALAGWDLSASAPTDPADTLDAHTAAIRGLFAAYFATGEVRYRDRAMAVYRRLDATFYDAQARIYAPGPAPMDRVEYTPLRFALLQSALRDVYEIVATAPGGEALQAVVEERIGRLDKLILNGWDDANSNGKVDWADECVDYQERLPHGGLQMAERTLTGETGSIEDQLTPGARRTPASDRDADCVPEIDDAHLPAALASSITFQITRP